MEKPENEGQTEQQQDDAQPAVENSPFAGRMGGNQTFILNRRDKNNKHLLAANPDAAPGMSLKDQFNLKPFQTLGLWKAAVVEGIGA